MTEQALVALVVKAATPRDLDYRKTRRAFRRKARVADKNGAFIAPHCAARPAIGNGDDMNNLDATGLRLVRKGVLVTKDGQTGEVVKTSRGACLVRWGSARYPNTEYCRELHVVETPRNWSNRAAMTSPQRAEAQSLRERIKVLDAAKYHASAAALRQKLRGLLDGENPLE